MRSKKKMSKKHAQKIKRTTAKIRQEAIARIDAEDAAAVQATETPTVAPVAKPRRGRKPEATGQPKRASGLDAAAQVLATAAAPMNAKDIVKAMADQGLWTSPGGKTPHATIYAAMVREITTKGDKARFKKTDRGLFTAA